MVKIDGFDIGSIVVLDEFDVELLHPVTGKPLGPVVTLLGPNHPARRKRSMTRQTKIRRSMERTGKIQFGDPETDKQDEIDELAACTAGWRGFKEDGKELPFNLENATRLYTNGDWVREQVSAAMNDRANFIKDSPKA